MMKRIVLAAAVVALGITAVAAQSDPLAARKALMKENGVDLMSADVRAEIAAGGAAQSRGGSR